MKRKLCALFILTFVLFTLALPVYAAVDGTDAAGGTTRAVTQEADADTASENDLVGMKAIACGIAISFAAGGGAIGMGIATGKAVEGLSRQPEVEGKKGYVCKICGYVYEGDVLPDDFICPLCKHGVADFEPIKN